MDAIKESRLRNIINEAINDYVDHGEFTPISNPSVNLKPNKRDVIGDNAKKLKYVCNKLMDALHNNSTYIKYGCEFEKGLNPMFWKNMPDGDKKKQIEIAHQIIARCNDLYNFLRNVEQQL